MQIPKFASAEILVRGESIVFRGVLYNALSQEEKQRITENFHKHVQFHRQDYNPVLTSSGEFMFTIGQITIDDQPVNINNDNDDTNRILSIPLQDVCMDAPDMSKWLDKVVESLKKQYPDYKIFVYVIRNMLTVNLKKHTTPAIIASLTEAMSIIADMTSTDSAVREGSLSKLKDLMDHVHQLDLSYDQKAKMEDIFKDIKSNLAVTEI